MSELGEVFDSLMADADELDNVAGQMNESFTSGGNLDWAFTLSESAKQQLMEAEALEAADRRAEAEHYRDQAGGTIKQVKALAETAFKTAVNCEDYAKKAHGRIAHRTHTSNQHVAQHAVASCAVLEKEAARTAAPIRKGIDGLPDRNGTSSAMTQPMEGFWTGMVGGATCIQHAQVCSSALREYVGIFRGGDTQGPANNDPVRPKDRRPNRRYL